MIVNFSHIYNICIVTHKQTYGIKQGNGDMQQVIQAIHYKQVGKTRHICGNMFTNPKLLVMSIGIEEVVAFPIYSYVYLHVYLHIYNTSFGEFFT